jgi:hypothetical protein
MNTEFEERLREEMGRVEVRPRPGLVREAYRDQRQRRKARRRAAFAAATGGVTAAAAAAAAIVLPSHTGAHPLADPSAKPVVQAKPGTTTAVPALPKSVPTSAPGVTYSIKPDAANVTVLDVLTKAATAVGSQANPGSGWPAGAYWHTEQQVISGGKLVSTDNIWTDASGDGVGEGTDDPPYPIGTPPSATTPSSPTSNGGQLPAAIGEKSYTWAQLDALPTDPAKLWPIVKADEQLPFSSDPALPKSGQSDLFESIWNLVTSEPVPAPLQKALYEVAAKIPGVTVAGQYTDSLGRTGTALHIGMWTMVVDPDTGQILAMMQAAGPPVTVCGTTGCTQQQTAGASTTVYITAGWASAASMPKIPHSGGGTAASGSGGSGLPDPATAPTPTTTTSKP